MARILIVDDHSEARRGARELLEAHEGWEICGEALNGVEAIEKAAALKPDIVIVDLSMPKMSGVQVARVIHSTAPQLPLLLFSLYAGDPQMTQGFRAAGFSGDINKAAANLLIEAVETLLRGGTYFPSSAVPRAIIADEAASQAEQAHAAATTAAAPQSSSDPPAATADAASTNPPETAPGSATEPC
jgi:DNA-binding NarL/FixJ family response regulator